MISGREWTSLFDRFVSKYGRLPTETDPDYLEMLRMGKYRILDVPDVSPAKCANCGSTKNDGRKYIDVGLHVDWYGAVYFCGLCLDELAHAMDLFKDSEEKLAKATAENDAVQELQQRGEHLHETLVETLKGIEKFYADIHSPSLVGSSNVSSVSRSVEAATEPRTNSTESRPSGTKSGTTKSATGAGSKNVRSLADLLDT